MESTGGTLKKIRLEKGLSLEEVHKKTKLHLNILRAIEEDSLLDFNPVYVKGFLKIYCNFLGVDCQDYIPGYKEPKSKVEYVSDFPRKSAPLLRVSSIKLPSLKARYVKRFFSVILVVVFLAILFNLGKAFSIKRGFWRSKPSLPAVKIQESSAVKIIRLDIRARENCFLQV